ncbi:MAG: carbohydrate kinase family protein [Candidatus Kerfeldbacteria bacterium]|nr:carbohydrate kinase family protein [Candidatus Kerfeldbacteria bacterium]
MPTIRASYDVITIGAATRDLFLRSPDVRVVRDRSVTSGEAALIPLGSKIDVRSLVVATGGGATNAAATFARFGFRTAFFGKVGDDDDGRAVLRDLQQRGIDTRFVVRDRDDPTALSVLLSVPHHGRTVLVSRGASSDLSRRDVPLGRVAPRWLYVTSLGGDLSLLRWVLVSASRRRIPVFVNPGTGELAHPVALRTILRRASVVLLNREEAGRLVGRRSDPVLALVRRLRRYWPATIICTDESAGAWAVAGATFYHAGTHPDARVVERTGAGDAFGSGFLTGLLRSNGDIALALQYATLNAESVMQRVGAKNGILSRSPSSRRFVPLTMAAL